MDLFNNTVYGFGLYFLESIVNMYTPEICDQTILGRTSEPNMYLRNYLKAVGVNEDPISNKMYTRVFASTKAYILFNYATEECILHQFYHESTKTMIIILPDPKFLDEMESETFYNTMKWYFRRVIEGFLKAVDKQNRWNLSDTECRKIKLYAVYLTELFIAWMYGLKEVEKFVKYCDDEEYDLAFEEIKNLSNLTPAAMEKEITRLFYENEIIVCPKYESDYFKWEGNG